MKFCPVDSGVEVGHFAHSPRRGSETQNSTQDWLSDRILHCLLASPAVPALFSICRILPAGTTTVSQHAATGERNIAGAAGAFSSLTGLRKPWNACPGSSGSFELGHLFSVKRQLPSWGAGRVPWSRRGPEPKEPSLAH